MADKIDSSKWTGDVPERQHVALNSPEGRKVLRGVGANIVLVVACGLALAAVFKVLS